MRATGAYIASAGTAAVMLGASLAALVLVSAFVAFGSWPGESSGSQVDQLLLNEVARPTAAKPVAVRTNAVQTAKRAQTHRLVAQARKQRGNAVRTADGNVVAKGPTKRTSPTTAAGTPVAALPGGTASPTAGVKQQTENVTKSLDTTTNQVTGNVNNTVDQTTTQVNQVVDQVVGTVQQTTDTATQQVQTTVGTTTGAVKDAAGGLLGH